MNSTRTTQPVSANAKTPRAASPFTPRSFHASHDILLQDNQPEERKENRTGLPDNLKAGIENLSGYSLDDVKVHYGSSRPAELDALAYTQSSTIYVEPGQERHLPHEAWHVVQQKQGRVQPTIKEIKGTVPVNDSATLEREADLMGAKAMGPVARPNSSRSAAPTRDRPVLTPAHTRSAATIQRYQVVPPANVLQNAPPKRPWWFGYPYAVVGATAFDAQAQVGGAAAGDEFLAGPGAATANIVNHPGGLSLRVSDSNDIAIEASNLVARQPKSFFATPAIVHAGNALLTAAGGQVSLQIGHDNITIVTGWYKQKTLSRVTPQFNGGPPNALPQNCNAIAARIIGMDPEAAASRGGGKALETVAHLAPQAQQAYRAAWNDRTRDFDDNAHAEALASEYVHHATEDEIEAQGANCFARPEVGESFMIATIGGATPLPNGAAQVHDYRSGLNRNLAWTFHFGGVVARSGGDRITLENYARGDNRQNAPDPRWYFQMYGEAHGQSFHEFHEASGGYANPVTVAVNRDTNPIPIHSRQGF